MRIEQEGIHFIPIHITIETNLEADVMWAALSSSAYHIAQRSQGKLDNVAIGGICYRMWEAYNNIHPNK